MTILRTGVFDVGAGGLRVGRGTPLSEEPADHVTSYVFVNDSTFLNGSRVYSAGNGVRGKIFEPPMPCASVPLVLAHVKGWAFESLTVGAAAELSLFHAVAF